jgi:hypothetical protein
MPIKSLTPEALYRRCDLSLLKFDSTDELEDLSEITGQDRAIEAITFGIGIKSSGYNMFVLGGPGTGKHAMVREFLARAAAEQLAPDDLCYINNFEDSQRPIALRLPPGTAVMLRADMVELVKDLRSALPSLFESEDYRNRRQVIEDEFKNRQEAAFDQLQERGKAKNLVLIRTPVGFAFAPVRNGAVVNPEEFQKMSAEEQRQIQTDMEALQASLEETIRQTPVWERERRGRVRDLNREVTMFSVGHVIDELQAKYREFADIVRYLEAVEKDIIEHVDVFLLPPG